VGVQEALADLQGEKEAGRDQRYHTPEGDEAFGD